MSQSNLSQSHAEILPTILSLFCEMRKLNFSQTSYVKILAAQDELPSSSSLENSPTNSQPVIYVPRFLIRVNVSGHIYPESDKSNRFEICSVTREIEIPCSTLTGPTCAAEAEKILSSKLSEWQIPLPGREHYGECCYYCGCRDADEDWVEEFQNFLRCVRGKIYNLGHNVIPVSLNIHALRPVPDLLYFEFFSTLMQVRQLNPNLWGLWKALLTSSPCSAAKGDCPICLEALDRADHLSLSCSHCFHVYCIGMWMFANPSCPACRFKFEDAFKV